jgi:nucleoside-diphosphate-sugar epimerase
LDNNLELESLVLDLDPSLANKVLGWKPNWSQQESIEKTLQWWIKLLRMETSAKTLCMAEILEI